MLRQYSMRRIAAFCIVDWLGTLALLQRTAPSSAGGQDAHLPLWACLWAALLWPGLFCAFSVYDGRRNATLRAELRRVALALCVATVALAGALALTGQAMPRRPLALFFALDVALLLGARVALWAWRRSLGGRRPSSRRVIIVGAGAVGQQLAGQLKQFAWADLDLVGYADDVARPGQLMQGLPALGKLDQLSTLVAALKVHDAVVALPLPAHERIVETCSLLQELGVHVHVVPDLFALSFPSAALDGFGGVPVIDLGQPGISGWRRIGKRVVDSTLAVLGLLALAPVLAAIAILIKIDSPGPVIFRQERIGEHGKPFVMFKFRSMSAGADPGVHRAYVTRLIAENVGPEQMGGADLKMAADPRVTRVGRIIRRASLDELPQLLNVLRGEMSLVGPRPALAYEVELYQRWHRRRLEAIPGITGLWQVEGRNQVSFDEMVRLDIKYIEQQSFWLDLWLILKTPFAALTGQGAG